MKSCLRQEKYKEDGAAPFNLYVNKCIYICKELFIDPFIMQSSASLISFMRKK